MIVPENKPILQSIDDEIFAERDLHIQMLRLDTIHTGISGNKWYKLKYNLEEAYQSGNDTILTFGGAYSNHIHATSIAAASAGLKSIGIIRGERVDPLNPTLKDAIEQGMLLDFVSRSEYRKWDEEGLRLQERFGSFYLVPEGGTNNFGIKGASEILHLIETDFDYVVVPVGTGGTIAGIICGLKGKKKVIGISVLKGDFLKNTVAQLVLDYGNSNYSNWSILNNYHFGGYAKFTEELLKFINSFKSDVNISLDPVYTGKMMYSLYDLALKDYFKPGTKIIAIHTGGLQGIRGFNERFGDLIL
jgi:1-aminocyclopropane-1-carboxylate deaminase/D-cysteine desulfhydrase-like pyridoxal-dependent ACC family enzyme